MKNYIIVTHMIIGTNNIVGFGSEKPFETLEQFDSVTIIEEIKAIDNEYIKRP